jgi:hypothetical protein
VLWKRRLVVAVGALATMALAVFLMRGASPSIGVASTAVMLDTPKSQVVDVEPVGADTMVLRAPLLADLAASDELRPQIASAMHIRDDQLVVTEPYLDAPPVDVPIARHALEAAAIRPEPYIVSLKVRSGLPIISVDTSAPTRAGAAQLAAVATDVLKKGAQNDWTRADLQAFRVESIGPVRALEVSTGSGKMMGAAAACVFFGIWCTAVVALSGLARARRRRRRARRLQPAR